MNIPSRQASAILAFYHAYGKLHAAFLSDALVMLHGWFRLIRRLPSRRDAPRQNLANHVLAAAA